MPECIEKGLGILQGGATYNGIQGEVVGLTNASDGLTAIKHLVFDEKRIGLPLLVEALDADFNGYEAIRAMCLGAPKFGNNHCEADAMRREVSRDIYGALAARKAELGGVHWPGEVIFTYHYSQGLCVGALPDGRRRHAVLADSAGPSQGADINGLTAVLSSAAKLPFDMLATSINLNLRFAKNFWDAQKIKIIAAFKTYFQTGGGQLQVNVTDAQALKDAFINPTAHKNLVVRVGGFSAYFINLNRDLQTEIISRTETGF